MPLTTKGTKQGSPGRPISVGYDPSQLSQNFKAADAQGQGIEPGAHPEFQGPNVSNPLTDIPKLVGKGLNWLTTYDPWKRSKPTRKP